MANTTPIIHKRTFVSGRLPSTNPANTRYINPGELSINLTDKKVISSNGSVLFEIGANITTSSITTLVANGTPGTPGQTLSSNGSSIYWTDNAGFTGSQGIQGDKGYTGSNGVAVFIGLIMLDLPDRKVSKVIKDIQVLRVRSGILVLMV